MLMMIVNPTIIFILLKTFKIHPKFCQEIKRKKSMILYELVLVT